MCIYLYKTLAYKLEREGKIMGRLDDYKKYMKMPDKEKFNDTLSFDMNKVINKSDGSYRISYYNRLNGQLNQEEKKNLLKHLMVGIFL